MSAAVTQERALLGLLEQLWGDSEVGATVRKRAKALNPQIVIPDEHPVAVEARAELADVRNTLSTIQKELAEERAAASAKSMESDLRSRLSKAQSRFKLTDDGMAGTIKLMQERQISDPEAAAALYVDGLPKAPPSAGSSNLYPGDFNLFGTKDKDDAWETLHTNPDKFFRDTVRDVFAEMPAGA